MASSSRAGWGTKSCRSKHPSSPFVNLLWVGNGGLTWRGWGWPEASLAKLLLTSSLVRHVSYGHLEAFFISRSRGKARLRAALVNSYWLIGAFTLVTQLCV